MVTNSMPVLNLQHTTTFRKIHSNILTLSRCSIRLHYRKDRQAMFMS